MGENVGLMDLERAKREVTIGDNKVTMLALSAAGIVRLLREFPVVQTLLNGGLKEEDFSLDAILTGAPELAVEIIVCGADQPGDKELIAHVSKLAVSTQLALLEGVIDATLEGGLAPFVASLNRILGGFGVSSPLASASPTEAPATT